MRSWRKMSVGLKVAIIATVVLALSIVGVLAAERIDGSSQDDAVKARETGVGSEPTPGDDRNSSGKLLELGTAAKISPSYRVAVTEISRYEIPSGLLLAVAIDATYTGKQDGEPWADLSVEFAGSGTQTYGESGCPSSLEEPDPADQPTLKADGEATYVVCIELPDTDVTRGRISVQEAFSPRDWVSWSTEETVTKTLPSVAPAAPSQSRAPVTRSQPDNDDASDARCEDFDKDEFEEYKEWGDEMKERYEANKGNLDEDDADDFEEWEDAYDKQIDRLEKWDEIC